MQKIYQDLSSATGWGSYYAIKPSTSNITKPIEVRPSKQGLPTNGAVSVWGLDYDIYVLGYILPLPIYIVGRVQCIRGPLPEKLGNFLGIIAMPLFKIG